MPKESLNNSPGDELFNLAEEHHNSFHHPKFFNLLESVDFLLGSIVRVKASDFCFGRTDFLGV